MQPTNMPSAEKVRKMLMKSTFFALFLHSACPLIISRRNRPSSRHPNRRHSNPNRRPNHQDPTNQRADGSSYLLAESRPGVLTGYFHDGHQHAEQKRPAPSVQ